MMLTSPLPSWIEAVAQRLHNEQLFIDVLDQAIVNEYFPGQGISAHVDCVPCFADTITSLSLGSATIMQFTHPKSGGHEELYLKERSLIVLSGPARYEWQHAIPARKSDVVNGFKISGTAVFNNLPQRDYKLIVPQQARSFLHFLLSINVLFTHFIHSKANLRSLNSKPRHANMSISAKSLGALTD